MKELFEYVIRFMLENDITCAETIWQSDRIREKHEEFMSKCFELVEKYLNLEESEESI